MLAFILEMLQYYIEEMLSKLTSGLPETMVDEKNTPPEPLHGGELGLGFGWATTISSRIVRPPTTLALFWPCVHVWIYDESVCGMCCRPWGPKGLWIIGSYDHIIHPNCLLSHDANPLLSLMQNSSTSQVV